MELSHERVHARDCVESEEKDDVMIDVIRRYMVVRGDLDQEQVERILQIAQRCPVHRTISGGPTIVDEIDLVT